MPYSAEMVKHLPIWNWTPPHLIHDAVSVQERTTTVESNVAILVRLTCPLPAACLPSDDSLAENAIPILRGRDSTHTLLTRIVAPPLC